MIIIYVFTFLILIFIFYKFLTKRNSGIPLLEVIIGSVDGFHYRMYFNKLNNEFKDIEYIRMILNFSAKMIYIIDKNNLTEKESILSFLEKISSSQGTNDDLRDQYKLCFKVEKGQLEGKKIISNLYYTDVINRKITTTIPLKWHDGQLEYSVYILILETYSLLDDFHKDQLKKSLFNLVTSYKNGADMNSLQVSMTLPNESFVTR
jgi:hypothetical protein